MVRTRFSKRRAVRIALPSLVLCGVLAGVALFAGSTARAAACGGSAITAADTPPSCTITGELDLTAGSLSLLPPTALSWADTLNGMEQYAYDENSAHQSFIVDDATGSGAGWNVTVAAGTFTDTAGDTLPASAFTVNGDLGSSTSHTAPHIGCTSGTNCTLANNTVTYPVGGTLTPINGTPQKLVNAETTPSPSGIGSNTVDTVGWWLTIPANVRIGNYTATVTLAINSTP